MGQELGGPFAGAQLLGLGFRVQGLGFGVRRGTEEGSKGVRVSGIHIVAPTNLKPCNNTTLQTRTLEF